MSPAIDGNGLDVARRIEAAARERPSQLSADLPLDLGEGRHQHPVALGPELLSGSQARRCALPESLHVDEDGLVGAARIFVATQTHRKIEHGVRVVATGSRHRRDSEFLPGLPVPQKYVGIEDRHLHGERECLALARGKLGAEIGDHRVVSCKHARMREDTIGAASTHIADGHAICRIRGAVVLNANHAALQSQAYARVRLVQSRIVEMRANDVIHRRTGRDLWNHGTHQQTSDRRVAVWKMRDVGIVLKVPARKFRRPDTRQANIHERIHGHSRIEGDAQVRRNALQ